MNDKQKAEALRRMEPDALRRILDSLPEWQNKQPTPEAPMAGQVHITGIGQVSVGAIRRELESKEA